MATKKDYETLDYYMKRETQPTYRTGGNTQKSSDSAAGEEKDTGKGTTARETLDFYMNRNTKPQYRNSVQELGESEGSGIRDWFDRYDKVIRGVTDYAAKRNGGYTTDASGGFSEDIASLIDEYEGIKGYAPGYGVYNPAKYLNTLKNLQKTISETDQIMAYFGSEDAYNKFVAEQEDYERKRTADLPGLEKEISSLEDSMNKAYLDQNLFDIYSSNDAISAVSADEMRRLQSEISGFSKEHGSIKQIQSLLNQKKKLLDQARDVQEQERLSEQQAQWQQKYQGQSYGELQSALSTMNPSDAEYQWLSEYAKSAMRTEDYTDGILRNTAEVKYLEDALREIRGVSDQIGLGGEDPATVRKYKELTQKYGNPSELEGRIEELNAEIWKYQKAMEYGFLDENEDYGELSSKVSDQKTAGLGIGWGTNWWGQGDPVYDYINNIDGAREVHSALEGKTPYSVYEYMTEKEIADYNYLYNAQGQDAAQGYLDYLEYTLDQRRMEQLQENTAAYADEHPVLSSALSVPTNLVSGMGVLDVAAQNAARKITGEYKPINYNSGGMVPTVVTSATRGAVSQKIADATGTISLDTYEHPVLSGILNGKSLGDVYQLGMSMVDSAAIAGLAAVGIPGGTALLGGSAASQGVLDALEAGANDSQALTMGILNGVFEALFEEVSLEKLLKGNTKGIIKSFLQQGAVEGSEEFFTTLANTVADTLVMAEKSDYRTKIAQYMSQGLDEKQATLKALEDIAIGMGWDFVGGMLTGGIMGAAAQPIQNYYYGKAASELYGSDPGALVNEALEIDPNNALAAKLSERINAGKKISGQQLYELAQQNDAAIREQDIAEAQKEASERLTSLGETGDVDSIGAAIAKQAFGQELTKSESQLLQQSQHGSTVLSELTQKVSASENASRTKQAAPGQENTASENTTPIQKTTAAEASQKVSENGKTTRITTGEEVKIDRIESLENGKMTFRLEDGSTVDSSDILYANEGDALVYETVAGMNVGADTANLLFGAYKTSRDVSAAAYARGIQEAFQYGLWNAPKQDMTRGPFSRFLTEHQQNVAYENGRIVARQRAEQEQAAKTKQSGKKEVGKVHYDGDRSSLNQRQQTSLSALETVADVLGIQIYVFESNVDAKGHRIGKNGWYDPEDGGIHIDLYAGTSGQDTMLFTAAHELTHFIRDKSPAKFQTLADFLMEEYGKKGVSVRYLVEEQIRKAKKNGRTIDYDTAYEEVVADSMETMLSDGKVVEKLQQKDKSVWEMVKDYIHDLAEKIRKAYAGLKPDSTEGKLVAGMKDSIEKIQELFTEGLLDAGENYQGATVKENTAQVGGETKFSIKNTSKMSLEDQLKSLYKRNLKTSDSLYFGETPDSISDSGLHKLPLAFPISDFKKSTQDKHNVPRRAIKALRANLEKALFSFGKDERIGFVVPDIDGDGKQLLIGIQANVQMDRKPVNVIHSVYGLDNPKQWIKNQIESGKEFILYNEKGANAFLQTYGYSASVGEGIQLLDNNIINDGGNVNKKFVDRDSESDFYNSGIRYSERVTDKDILSFLDDQETITTYKTMQIVDGKLYPPMAARIEGKHEDYSELGVWEQATEHPELIKENGKFKLDKGKGQGSIEAAYNPYMRSSNLVLNDQFSGAYNRTNLVTVECVVPVSEVTSGYHAQYAKDSVGWHPWHTGTVAGSIRKAKGIERQVFLSRWIKPVRIVTDAEVASMYKDLLSGTDIAVPDNVVTPSLLQELKKAGVKIEESGRVKYSDRDPSIQRMNQALEKENVKLKEDVTELKKLLKLQKSLTHGTMFTKSSVESMAKALMENAGAKGAKSELAGLLNEVYTYIAKNEDLTWEGVVEKAQPAVDWLKEHMETGQQVDAYGAEVLRELRGSRIYLDENQKKEAAYQFGSFNAYRKQLFGTVNITDKNAVSLDTKWAELAEMYPDVFDANITSTDMPGALLDAVGSLRDMGMVENWYDQSAAAQDLLTQVYDGYWRVSTLQTVADVKQKQIDLLKGQHLARMEKVKSDHKAEIAKLKQEHRAELKQVRQEYRESAEAKQRKIVQKYQESRAKGVESRNKTVMRHKVQNVVKELNDYLLKGTKDKHVPIELQKAVAEALDAVNMDTVGADERIAKLEEKLLNAKTAKEAQEISRTIDRVRSMGDSMKSKLQALKDGYEEIIHSDDPMVANAYDPGIAAQMMTLMVEVGDTPLRDMSLRQLEAVHDVYTMVLTTIRNANKTFKAARNATVRELGQKVMAEVKDVGGKRQYSTAGMEAIRKFGWNNLKPVYAFEMIGSGTFSEIFKNVRAGEDVWAVDVNEARDFYLETAKKYGYNTWDNGKQYEFTSTSGMNFHLNLEQIMSLYAYSKREQAADHLRKGGIVIDETTEVTMKTKLGVKVKFNPTEATAYNISDDTLMEIIGKLTPEQKSFVDEMQTYLSSTMGEKGNEVSLQLYGVKLFKEKNYFPLKSASQYMAKAKEQQQGEVKIKNSGFSKETVKHASNPVVLTPFMQVWADHVNDMSMYHAFVLPMEDFYRVYNYKTPTSDFSATESVEMSIQNAYGKGATKYIDQLLKDLNGGARVDSTTGVINKSMNLYKKGAVFASASVVIQQPSAIARALSMIDMKYFAGPKVDKNGHKVLWEELKHYAPVAAIKEMGYFDTNMGKSTQDYILGQEYEGIGEKAKALFTDSGYRDEALSRGAALADEITWCSIWEAVKRETKAKNPGMDVKSEEFLKLAGERFTDVIVKTQVYDSVLSRSANMRSKDTGMKMATAFMSEPTTSINMVVDALVKGKRNGVEGRRYCRRAIGSVVAAQILNSILVSFVYAARDDDEDETYLEKYAGSFVAEVIDGLNPATYIPFIKDIVSIVQGYDVERSDMAVVSDLWNAWEKLDSNNLSGWRKVEGFAGSICQIFGQPLKNIMRDIRGMYQAIDTFTRGQKTTLAGLKYAIQGAVTGKDISDREQLYQAYLAGDAEHLARVQNRYDGEDSYNTAMRTAIREHFIAGDIDETDAAKYLVKYGTQDGSEAHWTVEEWKYAKANGTSDGYGKYDKFYTAVRTGENLKAVIQEYTDNGVSEYTLSKQITSYFKPMYVRLSTVDRSNIKGYLLNALEFCGVERDAAMERIGDWDFEAQYGFAYDDRKQAYMDGQVSAADLRKILVKEGGYTAEDAAAQVEVYDWAELGYDATVSNVKKYNTYCKPAGVPKDAYLQIVDFSNNTENDVDEDGNTIHYSAVKKIMKRIDQLSITDNQKTAIALSLWKESTVVKYKLW